MARLGKSKSKPKSLYVCQSCGHQVGKWQGRCPQCGEWNSLVEEIERVAGRGRVSQLQSVGGLPSPAEFHSRSRSRT